MVWRVSPGLPARDLSGCVDGLDEPTKVPV